MIFINIIIIIKKINYNNSNNNAKNIKNLQDYINPSRNDILSNLMFNMK
jgi:hypothetical protein